jgi:hypothetical protein
MKLEDQFYPQEQWATQLLQRSPNITSFEYIATFGGYAADYEDMARVIAGCRKLCRLDWYVPGFTLERMIGYWKRMNLNSPELRYCTVYIRPDDYSPVLPDLSVSPAFARQLGARSVR